MSKNTFTIIAFIDGPGLGDGMLFATNAAWIKRNIENSLLIACFTPRSEVFAEALNLCPDIDYLLVGESGVTSYDLMDPHYSPPDYMPQEVRDLIGNPDLIVNQSMVDSVNRVAEGAILEVPDWYLPEAKNRLCAMGMDPKNWFVCLHMREDGYRGEIKSPRSIRNFEPYSQLIDHIIDELGGQVVRLGDQSMTPFNPRPGLFDLSAMGAPLFLQCFTASHARFLIGTDSGPSTWCYMFNTPLGHTNSVVLDSSARIFPSLHVFTTKTFVMNDGSRLSGQAANEAGIMNEQLWRNKTDRLIEAPPDELKKVADYLFERTVHRPPWEPSEQMKKKNRDPSEFFSMKGPQPGVTYIEDV